MNKILLKKKQNIKKKDNLEIVWSTNIDPSGYSSCARSYIKALYNNKNCSIKIIINNVARNINLMGLSKEDLLFFSSLNISKLPKKDSIFVQHCVPDRAILNNSLDILYTVTEMCVPNRWVRICNSCDLIMTASNFCKEKMEESGIKSNIMEVVPHCHDKKVWNPSVKPLNIGNLKDFNFLFIGDYTPRKGGDILVKNFIKTFAGKKDVSLTLKAYFNSFSDEDQELLIKRIEKTINETKVAKSKRPKVFFYGDIISEDLMPRFIKSFDCLVSPHRGEGWGLPISYSMALGLPTIATNYSGNLEFMNEKNSFLIDILGFEPVCREMAEINPNFEDREWPIVDEDDLCDKMKFIYDNSQKAKEIGNKGSETILNKFSYNIISNKIINILGGRQNGK